MDDVRRELDTVVALIAAVEPQQAEERLTKLVAGLDRDELLEWSDEIRGTIARFLPKRAKRLLSALETTTTDDKSATAKNSEGIPRYSQVWASGRIGDFRADLQNLSNYYIFQWNTHYPDVFNRYMADFVQAGGTPADSAVLCSQISDVVRAHVTEVFQKGYDYVTRRDDPEVAHIKSIAGIQRLLDIIVEYYSTRVTKRMAPSEAESVRWVVSSVLAGAIAGYSRVDLGLIKGEDLLASNFLAWAPTLAFLTGADADSLADELPRTRLGSQVRAVIVPLDSAIDVVVSESRAHAPLPWIARYHPRSRSLQITLSPAPRGGGRGPVEVYAFMDAQRAQQAPLAEIASSEFAVVVAPKLGVDHELPNADRSPVFLPATGLATDVAAVLTPLRRTVLAQQARLPGSAPLTDNYASNFPLQEPRLIRSFYHVQRPTVRGLLSRFERRNGVRLWCSVRRSGKTTAGHDLGSESGDSIVISQTCEDTGEIEDGARFYQSVKQALDDDDRLPSDFVLRTLDRCSESGEDVRSKRVVLVMDEYETLFGELSRTLRRNPDARYTVVQPLLNQLVAFSRENLLVFMGQQPNAHFIMMDQNQLSPLVLQDSFPLFENQSTSSEFGSLLGKILSSQMDFDRSFGERVFSETGGHPYLTANLMVDFVDWLIHEHRSHASLHFTMADFSRFAQRRLRKSHLAVAGVYNVFRDGVVANALSNEGMKRSPWLHVVYTCLQRMALNSPETFSVTRDEFKEICSRVALPLNLTPDSVLSAGAQANFFYYTERAVAPKIRLLARLAAVAPVSLEGV